MHRVHHRVVAAAAVVVALALLSACIPPPSAGPAPTTTETTASTTTSTSAPTTSTSTTTTTTSTTSTSTTTTTVPPALPSWTFEVSEGALAIHHFVADLADAGLVIRGEIDDEGGIVVPADGISMSMVEFFSEEERSYLGVWIEAVAPGTGSYDATMGELELDIGVRFRLRSLTAVDNLGPSCRLGGVSDPIELQLATATPSDPNPGQLQLLDDLFVVTAAQACGLLTPYVSEALGVPSEPGDASLELTGTVTIGD